MEAKIASLFELAKFRKRLRDRENQILENQFTEATKGKTLYIDMKNWRQKKIVQWTLDNIKKY